MARTRKEARYDRIWAIALEKRLAKDRREQLRDRQQIAATRKMGYTIKIVSRIVRNRRTVHRQRSEKRWI